MKPSVVVPLAAGLIGAQSALAADEASSAPPVRAELRLIARSLRAPDPAAGDPSALPAAVQVQWTVPVDHVAVRLAGGPALALDLPLDLSRHEPAPLLASKAEIGEFDSAQPSPMLYKLELSLLPADLAAPAALPAGPSPGAVPSPGAASTLPLAAVALHRRRYGSRSMPGRSPTSGRQ